MIDNILKYMAPHLCFGCGKIGEVLCGNCKYNINEQDDTACILCGGPAIATTGLCGQCQVPYQRAWHVGERSDELRAVIDAYKFDRVRAAHATLASLLFSQIGQLPSSTVIVPVPTISSHIRQRGYDHVYLVARSLAKLQKVKTHPLLQRLTSTSQRGASRSQRIVQAGSAFVAPPRLRSDIPYLIIDDIITTGATLNAATRALHSSGARTIWVAAIARQPLD